MRVGWPDIDLGAWVRWEGGGEGGARGSTAATTSLTTCTRMVRTKHENMNERVDQRGGTCRARLRRHASTSTMHENSGAAGGDEGGEFNLQTVIDLRAISPMPFLLTSPTDRLNRNVITPTTKAETHDVPISPKEIVAQHMPSTSSHTPLYTHPYAHPFMHPYTHPCTRPYKQRRTPLHTA